MSPRRPAQILFRFFVGLHYKVVMRWEEYYHKILLRLKYIAVNVVMIGFRSKIAHSLTYFSIKIFQRAFNLSSSKRWTN